MAYRSINQTVLFEARGEVTSVFDDLSSNRFYTFVRNSQGYNFGYTSGGSFDPVGTGIARYNIIDRFPFSVDTTNATDVGDLTVVKAYSAGNSSSTYGYDSAGSTGPNSGPIGLNTIQRFPFADSVTNASNVGNLNVTLNIMSTQNSNENGYTAGGNFTAVSSVINKFPFASSSPSGTNIGNLSVARTGLTGQSSYTHGYASGGQFLVPATPANAYDIIDRFLFADATVTALDVGNLTVARKYVSGQSSTEHGYISGGETTTASNVIDRFPFAAALTNATNVGTLTSLKSGVVGQSSVTHGYISGGKNSPSPTAILSVIERFPFAMATTNATNVGNLTAAREFSSSQQY